MCHATGDHRRPWVSWIAILETAMSVALNGRAKMAYAGQIRQIDRVNLACCAAGTATGCVIFSFSGPASRLKYEFFLDPYGPIMSLLIIFLVLLYFCTKGGFARSIWPVLIGIVAIFPAVGLSGILYCDKVFPSYQNGLDLYSLLFVPFVVTPCLSWAWLFGAEAGAGYVCARYVAQRFRRKIAA